MIDWSRDEYGHGCFAVDLDGHKQAFVPSIRDRLIQRGVLHCVDGIWHLDWHGFDLDRERAADMSCCDFCSERPVCWLVPCDTFQMPVTGKLLATSQGDWAACDTCGTIITQGHRQALLQRAMAARSPMMPANPPPALYKMLHAMKQELHHRFWQHVHGQPVRIPSHPFGH
jgi:hypothetical protein